MKAKTGFKQSDITRALRGAQTAGQTVTEVTISPSLEIKLKLQNPKSIEQQQDDDWDEVIDQ
ncbi:hypothetical protein [Cohaesibacter gelatinilyticus]|uniref:Uncharacterized protein n=1 Tax=Cohaesibacter gelatinilyticus TaxID=372072 RepID=A0A285NEP2_9HYPH|nr:hypothetical protein [Cohaesibacter gelatinilyticus]SNZ07437.1 hypothetical protein SAMN06265368_0958 [Cohaesibacter gelatinilyticus]